MDFDGSPSFGYLDYEFPLIFCFVLPGAFINRRYFRAASPNGRKCEDLLATASYCLGLSNLKSIAFQIQEQRIEIDYPAISCRWK